MRGIDELFKINECLCIIVLIFMFFIFLVDFNFYVWIYLFLVNYGVLDCCVDGRFHFYAYMRWIGHDHWTILLQVRNILE